MPHRQLKVDQSQHFLDQRCRVVILKHPSAQIILKQKAGLEWLICRLDLSRLEWSVTKAEGRRESSEEPKWRARSKKSSISGKWNIYEAWSACQMLGAFVWVKLCEVHLLSSKSVSIFLGNDGSVVWILLCCIFSWRLTSSFWHKYYLQVHIDAVFSNSASIILI